MIWSTDSYHSSPNKLEITERISVEHLRGGEWLNFEMHWQIPLSVFDWFTQGCPGIKRWDVNLANFMVIPPIFYCQLPAVGFPGLRPEVVSRALKELRKGSQKTMARKGLAQLSHEDTKFRKQKSRTESVTAEFWRSKSWRNHLTHRPCQAAGGMWTSEVGTVKPLKAIESWPGARDQKAFGIGERAKLRVRMTTGWFKL